MDLKRSRDEREGHGHGHGGMEGGERDNDRGAMNKHQRREEMKHEDSSSRIWGQNHLEKKPEPIPEEEKDKANFGLTGALAKDKKTGNMYNGVLMKWSEPPDAAQPTRQWRLYVFKADEILQTLHIHRQSAFLIGRDDRVADILLDHPSCSKQHAVIQYRLIPVIDKDTGKTLRRVVTPYLMDLGSSNKTFLNGSEIDEARYYELREKDVVKFGASSREYVLLHDEATAVESHASTNGTKKQI